MEEFFLALKTPCQIIAWFYVVLTPVTIVLVGIAKAVTK